VTLTELPPLGRPAGRLLDAGRGGDGPDRWDDDFGEGWGWSEGPFDDETPYRRPRIIRALAIVLALVVITGSAGAYVAVMTLGSAGRYPVSDVSAAVPSGQTTSPHATVSFVVSNSAAHAGRALCTATIATQRATAGSARVRTDDVPGGGSLSLAVRVALSPAALAGGTPAAVRVGCVPVPSHAG
jgi:hypothetical protein